MWTSLPNPPLPSGVVAILMLCFRASFEIFHCMSTRRTSWCTRVLLVALYNRALGESVPAPAGAGANAVRPVIRAATRAIFVSAVRLRVIPSCPSCSWSLVPGRSSYSIDDGRRELEPRPTGVIALFH